MHYFKQYLGAQGEGATPSGAETVERLCDRVQSSTLLEDRRDAVRALKSLSRKFRLEVGTQAMEILVHVLQTDRNDSEIIGYTLDTLCNVMSNEPVEDGEEMTIQYPEELGSQFTEMFIKNNEHVGLLLSLLEEYDFHVRWPSVKLLTILLTNEGRNLQEAILVSPMGVSKLVDLLSDSREIIRNDGLLLLIQLTKGNASIQKIVAFENAFERLLDIVSEEGNSDGGIVVEDCLLLVLNLLKNNTSNQNFFKEGSFIQKLTPFFHLETLDNNQQGGWSAQKVTNIHLMLQLVRTLVSPNNSTQALQSCQKVMNQCGLLQQLCSILMASGVPADVLTETINTVAEMIRGNTANQEYFASVMAPSNPPRAAIVVLLMSMVNEKQPFVLRCAVLYCFQSFLYKNELGQSQIIQTLLPTSTDVSAISAGQLLCGGLFSADTLSTWFAAIALLHSIGGNFTQKEQLLRVQLATSLGNPPVSLQQQCTNIIAQGAKFQTRIAILQLLCCWMTDCPLAVTHFLSNAANVPFLISQISASEVDEYEALVQGLCAFLLGICVINNKDEVENHESHALQQIIEKRIGIETFTDKLTRVTKHECYSRAAKNPQLVYKQANEVIFDFEFTRLFKKLENDVLDSISVGQGENGEKKKKRQTMQQHESIVEQYKELIREQDSKLNETRTELEQVKSKLENQSKKEEEMTQEIQQLKDKNALLKAQKGIGGQAEGVAEIARLQQEIKDKNKEMKDKEDQIGQLRNELLATKSDTNAASAEANTQELTSKLHQLNIDIEDANSKIEQKDEEIKVLKGQYEDAKKQKEMLSSGTEDGVVAALKMEQQSMSKEITELKDKLKESEAERERLKSTVNNSEEEIIMLKEQIRTLEAEKTNMNLDMTKAAEDAEAVKKEQEDLLILLSDQDSKLQQYRQKLKDLGQVIEDDEDDDDDSLGDDDDDA